MHRTIQMSVAPGCTDVLVKELEDLDAVVGLSVQPGASRKPRGDVVTVHALNRGADAVLAAAAAAGRRGESRW